MSEPRTEAGRRLIEGIVLDGGQLFGGTHESITAAILAIEAEASSSDELRAALDDHWPEIHSWIDDSTWLACSCGWDSSEPKAVDWVTHLRAALHASRLDADKEGER